MRRKTLLALTLLSALASAPAPAGTSTATLTVRATVENGCTVAGDVLDFGTYLSGQSRDATGHAQLEIHNCNGMQVTISVSGGNSGNPSGRYMTSSAADQLNYQIYKSPGRQDPWVDPMNTSISGDPGIVDIYGVIPAGQTVAPGVYEDTLTVTVNFR